MSTPSAIRLPVFLFLWLLACTRSEAPDASAEKDPTSTPAAIVPQAASAEPALPAIGPKPASWVQPRVEQARARLRASEAGARVWQAIEAHGGLATWLGHGTVEFEFDYAPIGNPERRMHTFQRMDLWRAHGRHRELGEGADAEFGYDGDRAWMAPGPEAFPSTARFWTTTPYYFIGMPFVLGDPGAKFEALPDAELEGTPHHLVKVTYEAGTGDSPDDYYILYLHPETHVLSALRYIVAYPGFFEAGKHSPEKLMVYSEVKRVGGLRVAGRLDTYRWDAERAVRGDKVTEVAVDKVAFGKAYPDALFAPIEGAVVEPALSK